MISVRTIGGSRVGVVDVADIIEKKYAPRRRNFSRHPWVGVMKSDDLKRAEGQKVLSAPYSMAKLLDLVDVDGYHAGCIDAIVNCTIMKVACKNEQVNAWLKSAEFPGNDSASVIAEMVRHYASCGNGFLMKMRDATGAWRGLERLLPTETQILEYYDDCGVFRPDYMQTKNGKRRWFSGRDIIHFKRSTHKSNAWGVVCLPVVINIELLKEVKKFDYNNFKHGLLIDYIIIVEGGTLKGDEVLDADGKAVPNAFNELEQQLRSAAGNDASHGTILIESENPAVKIRLEPLRQEMKDGGFKELKKDLRHEIFAYHRVPPRVVSQLIAGSLGGDYKNDMLLFKSQVTDPLQNRIAAILAREFNDEFGWGVEPADFSFGDPAEPFENPQDALFRTNMRPETA